MKSILLGFLFQDRITKKFRSHHSLEFFTLSFDFGKKEPIFCYFLLRVLRVSEKGKGQFLVWSVPILNTLILLVQFLIPYRLNKL